MSELEALRARCAAQEQQIQRLEGELRRLKPSSAGALASAAMGQTTTISASQAAPPHSTALRPEGGLYVVAPGDSLEKIANRKGCTVPALLKANGLKASSVIHPGQKLKLPEEKSAVADATPPAAPGSGSTYTIQSGDTFASIARKQQTSVADLVSANPNVKPNALRPGQVIQLAAPASAASEATMDRRPSSENGVPRDHSTSNSRNAAETAKAASPIAEPPSVPSTSPSNPEKKIRSVTIEGEMTYGEFAAKHGTDTSRLNDLNGLDLTNATVLAKGSELYVPAQP